MATRWWGTTTSRSEEPKEFVPMEQLLLGLLWMWKSFALEGFPWLSQGRASPESGHSPCHHDKIYPDSPRAARQTPGDMLGAFMAAVEYTGFKTLWVLRASLLCCART